VDEKKDLIEAPLVKCTQEVGRQSNPWGVFHGRRFLFAFADYPPLANPASIAPAGSTLAYLE